MKIVETSCSYERILCCPINLPYIPPMHWDKIACLGFLIPPGVQNWPHRNADGAHAKNLIPLGCAEPRGLPQISDTEMRISGRRLVISKSMLFRASRM